MILIKLLIAVMVTNKPRVVKQALEWGKRVVKERLMGDTDSADVLGKWRELRMIDGKVPLVLNDASDISNKDSAQAYIEMLNE